MNLSKKILLTFILLFLLSFFSPVTFFINGLTIALLFLMALYTGIRDKVNKDNFRSKYFFSVLIYMGLIFGYSIIELSFDLVVHKISILIFPLIFILTEKQYDTKVLQKIFYAVILIPIITIVLFFIKNSFEFTLDLSKIGRVISIHRPFFGMCLGTSILFIIHRIKNYLISPITKYLLLVLALSYFAFACYLFAKMAIIAILVCVGLYFIFQIKSIKIRNTILGGLMLVGTGLYFFSDNLMEAMRQNEYLNNRIQWAEGGSIGPRKILWTNGLELLKENPILGYGRDDLQIQMNQKIANYSWLKGMGVHMDILDHWLVFGIWGLLIYIGFIFVPFAYPLDTNGFLWRIFAVFFFLVSLTETILYRHWGMVYFSFINGLLYLNYKINSKKHTS